MWSKSKTRESPEVLLNTLTMTRSQIPIKRVKEMSFFLFIKKLFHLYLCIKLGVSWEDEDEISRENLSTSADCKSAVRNFKLVLAEPLPDHPHSHVNNFIRGRYFFFSANPYK